MLDATEYAHCVQKRIGTAIERIYQSLYRLVLHPNYNLLETIDWGLRTSLAKEIEGQMSTVTKLPNVSAQSRALISGRSKEYMAQKLIYPK